MWKQKEVELYRQAWRHLDMTDTWHTRTQSKAAHKTNYEPEYPRIHPELHWECWQHSGKQRMDFVRGEFLLLAQGSTAEIKGSSFDIINNFDFKKSSTCRLLQRNWEWKIGLCPCTIVWPRAVLCVCTLGSLAAAAYGLWSYAGHSVPKGSISLGVGEPGK